MKRVKVGVLGTTHVHAPTYLRCLLRNEAAEIVGIYDNDNEGNARTFAEVNGLSMRHSAEEVLALRPDFVLICTENTRHIEMFRHAANARTDILCEKPLATTVADLDEMLSVSQKNSIKLMTSFPNRYIHSYRSAKQAYHSGRLGRLLGVKATNKGEMPGGWFVEPTLSGGGCVMDHTVHVADLMNHLLGSSPVSVRAVCSRRLYDTLTVEDVALVSFLYPDGIFVTLDSSWSRTRAFPYARDLTLRLFGDRGSASVDYFAESNKLYSNERGAFWSYYGEDKDQMMIDDIIAAYQSGGDFPITGLDGYRSAMVAIAAYRSLEEKREVRISELGGIF